MQSVAEVAVGLIDYIVAGLQLTGNLFAANVTVVGIWMRVSAIALSDNQDYNKMYSNSKSTLPL